jgi:hypothetical protein
MRVACDVRTAVPHKKIDVGPSTPASHSALSTTGSPPASKKSCIRCLPEGLTLAIGPRKLS